MLIRLKKAQNTMEYAILISVVVGAFSAMQIYFKRGLQARIRGGSDKIYGAVLEKDTSANSALVRKVFTSSQVGEDSGQQRQFEPYYLSEAQYNIDTTSSEGEEEIKVEPNKGKRTLSGKSVSRTGTQEILGIH